MFCNPRAYARRAAAVFALKLLLPTQCSAANFCQLALARRHVCSTTRSAVTS